MSVVVLITLLELSTCWLLDHFSLFIIPTHDINQREVHTSLLSPVLDKTAWKCRDTENYFLYPDSYIPNEQRLQNRVNEGIRQVGHVHKGNGFRCGQ